ncbi:MAG: glycosyltransferase, partial [Planctomycetes bacterium]|nr:glycosyltransferase [Planctomycetota bacterium]
VLVVDDGSTDSTAAVAEEFGPPVLVVKQSNGGASAARNTGVARADTEWIAFLDSDDYWEAGHVAALRAAISATGGAAEFYFADMQWPVETGTTSLFGLCAFAAAAPHQLVDDATDWVMLRRQPMMLQASAIRRSSYLALGGLRDELRSRHDTHLFLRLGIGRPACALPACGTVMTADDTVGRVTAVLGDQKRSYWVETVVMYQDVLAQHSELPRHHRAELASRLAAARLRLAKFALRGGNLAGGGYHLVRAAVASPRRWMAAVRRRLGGG